MFGTMNRQNHQNPMNQFDSTQMPYAAQSYPSHHRFYRESQSQLFAEKHPVLPDISFMTVGDKDAAYALENPDCKSAALPRNVLNADGQRMVEIPDFESMTMFMMRKDGADQRKPIYDYLNQQLRLGRLARIVGFPVLNRCIDGAACNLKRFNYWELSRNEFYADIEVELKLMTHAGVQTWKGVLVCYCCFGDEFEMTIEELRTSIDRREEGWVPLDPFLIQVYNGAQIDYEAELMWTRHQLQDALTDPKKRKARNRINARLSQVKIFKHDGERFEIVGISVSYQLSVPHFRMRARMIQLMRDDWSIPYYYLFDEAKGAWLPPTED